MVNFEPSRFDCSHLSTEEDAPTVIYLHGEPGFSKRAWCRHVRVDMTRIVLKVLLFLAADMSGWLVERTTRTRTL